MASRAGARRAGEEDELCFSFCALRDRAGGEEPGAKRRPSVEKAARPKFGGPREPLLRSEGGSAAASPVAPRADDFDYMLVFPLPSATTEAEETEFRRTRERAAAGKDYARFLRDTLVDPEAKENASIACADSLKSLRASAIELILSVLGTLGKEQQCEVFRFTSVDSDELFVCVRVNEQLGESLAAAGNYQLQLGGEFLNRLHVSITKDTDNLVPAYAQYNAYMKDDNLVRRFDVPGRPGETSILRQVDKARLIYDAITDYVNISELERLGLVKCALPVHNPSAVAPLQENWATFRLAFRMQQPIDEVRDYFGEEVAFYFLFVQMVSHGLLYLSCLAVPCTLAMMAGFASIGKVVFTFGNMIWFTALLKAWQRQQTYYANKWGTDQLDMDSVKEPLNPDFKGKLLPASYDENVVMLQADTDKQRKGYAMSAGVTVLYMIVVLGAAAKNQMLAAWCDTNGYKKAFTLCTLGLTVQIKVFDFFWDMVGTWLTHQEQHVELKTWNQSKSMKTFFMKFITAFNVFYYIAFAQPALDPVGCEKVGGCKGYLQQQLVTCFVTYIAFGVLDVMLPFLKVQYAMHTEQEELKKKCLEDGKPVDATPLSFLEQQGKMLPYEGVDATGDYLQVMLPLAFVVLFGAVMPLCALLCFLGLATQLRADAWKLLNSYQRTFPAKASGIGIWNQILSALSYVSVINNTALLLTQVDDWRTYLPFPEGFSGLTAFFILENIFMCVKVVCDNLVSDTPDVTARERERQDVQRSRLFEAENDGSLGEVKLECSGDVSGSIFSEVQKLEPGHALFSEPPPRGSLW